MAPQFNSMKSTTSTSNSTTSGSGRNPHQCKILELQKLIATHQIELRKLTRFPRGDFAKAAVLKEQIARETRQLHLLQTSYFKMDFDGVRVRDGEAPKQLGAMAATRDDHVHFKASAYDPGASHEISHEIQRASQPRPQPSCQL
jgi:hypothetical protein